MPRIDWGRLGLGAYLAALFVFLIAPLLIVVVVSFNPEAIVRFPPRGFSLHWFRAVVESPTLVQAIANSIRLGALATVISILVAVPAALALGRYEMPGRNVAEAVLLSPLTLPMIVLGIALLFLYSRLGLGLSFAGLLAAHVVITIPYILRCVLGVYRGLDASLEDSARVLGATPWKAFRHVTWPLLRPGIVAGSIFSFLISFDNVPVSIFLTTSTTTTLPVAILSQIVYSFEPTIAAISTLEMLAVVVVLWLVEQFYGLRQFTAFGAQ